jgi:hypothetical protein
MHHLLPAAFLATTLAVALSQAIAQSEAYPAFASDNFTTDAWGVYDSDFSWQSSERWFDDWSVEGDWREYGAGETARETAFGVELLDPPRSDPLDPDVRDRVWTSYRDWYLDYVVPGDDDRMLREHADWSARAQRDWNAYSDAGDPDWLGF